MLISAKAHVTARPLNRLQRQSAEKSYRQVERLLQSIVFHHMQKYGGDYDDIFEEALGHFLNAWERYDPSKGQLTTWVRHRVSLCLFETVRRDSMRRTRRPKTVAVDPDSCMAAPPSKLWELLSELSDDAVTVIKLVLEAPDDIKDLLRAEKPRRCKVVLWSLLDDRGWSAGRIQKAFAEIGAAL